MNAKSRSTAPLWLSALLVIGGAALTMGPGLVDAPRSISDLTEDCSPRTKPPTPQDTEEAAALADSIWSSPEQASCLLSMHSMTSGELHELMTEIAADPRLAEDYARARRLGRRL